MRRRIISVINTKDYNNKDEFWKAVHSEIDAGKSHPSPSGHYQFSGKIHLIDEEVIEF